jgi:hypothetical protein
VQSKAGTQVLELLAYSTHAKLQALLVKQVNRVPMQSKAGTVRKASSYTGKASKSSNLAPVQSKASPTASVVRPAKTI